MRGAALGLGFLAFFLAPAPAIPFFKSDRPESADSSGSVAAPETGKPEKSSRRGLFKRGDDKKKGQEEPAAKEKKKSWFPFRDRDRADIRWPDREAPEPGPNETAAILRTQIYLDSLHIGPGKIDGALGDFTRKAVVHYNRKNGVEPGNWYRIRIESEEAVPEIHRAYTIQEGDSKFVGALPYDPPEQAEKDYMYYRSFAEFTAERFHTDANYLQRANPGRNLNNLKVGDTLLVPNVAPFKIEDIAKNQLFKADPALSDRHVIVDTKQKLAFILQDEDHLVAAFPITPGHERYIPYGSWKIDTMVTTPTFRYDKQMLEEGVRGEEFHMLPPGPNSPVGIFWAGLTKSGIGLHGTNEPESIGRARSSGCIRLANWDAVRLSSLVRPGATVEVR